MSTGGMLYLILVVVAWLGFIGTLLYATLQSPPRERERMAQSDARGRDFGAMHAQHGAT